MTTKTLGAEGNGEDHGFAESIETTVHGLRESASVETVYGEPIHVGGKTVVPIARIAYGFGGGFGQGQSGDEAGLGSGVGGGVVTRPVGVLEVTERETRLVRVSDSKPIALGVALGVGLGRLLRRR
jgi:uncharacterized spore protein YtfJ